MIWPVAAVLVLVLVGLPLVVLPSGLLAFVAVPSAALCAGGVAARSVPLLTAGATLAVIEYAFALSIAGGPLDLLTAMVFGVALLLLLELVDFRARTHGAAVGASVMASMIRYWLALVGAGAALSAALVGGAAAVRLAVPLSSPAAAAGALGAFVAAVGVLKLVTTSDHTPRSEGGEGEVRARPWSRP